MPFTAYHLTPDGDLRAGLDEREVRTVFESREGLLWVDVKDTTAGDIDFLERVSHFHELALADCVSRNVHPPEIDNFDDHLFIVLDGINYTTESEIVELTELAVFLGPHFVVSNHTDPLFSIDTVKRLVEYDGRPMRSGADFLAHVLMDALIDNIFPAIEKLGQIADDIEEESIRDPRERTLEALLNLKRSTLRLNRVVTPQREVMNRLRRGHFPVIREEVHIFYGNVYDHMMRLEQLNQTLWQRADHALATYLSALAIRQNETMKVLSIVASIFLPLTLVAGIYGMNFENIPELEWSWGYFGVLGFMGTVTAAAMWWFWARRWITWRRRHISRVRPFAVETGKLFRYLSHVARWPQP